MAGVTGILPLNPLKLVTYHLPLVTHLEVVANYRFSCLYAKIPGGIFKNAGTLRFPFFDIGLKNSESRIQKPEVVASGLCPETLPSCVSGRVCVWSQTVHKPFTNRSQTVTDRKIDRVG
jgi:hypothetical protein